MIYLDTQKLHSKLLFAGMNVREIASKAGVSPYYVRQVLLKGRVYSLSPAHKILHAIGLDTEEKIREILKEGESNG